jgi:hypothetical protein
MIVAILDNVRDSYMSPSTCSLMTPPCPVRTLVDTAKVSWQPATQPCPNTLRLPIYDTARN